MRLDPNQSGTFDLSAKHESRVLFVAPQAQASGNFAVHISPERVIMSDRFSVKPLERRRIDQAWPLVQTGRATEDREAWRRYAGRLLRSTDSGIRTVEGDHGYIHGIYAYQAMPSPRHDKVFQVDLFLALDLIEPEVAIDLLLQDMDQMALELGCAAIHLHLPQREGVGTAVSVALTRAMEHGHYREDLRLCRPLS